MSIHKAPHMATGALPNRPSTDLPHPSNPRYALLMRNLRDDELFRPLPLTRACRKRGCPFFHISVEKRHGFCCWGCLNATNGAVTTHTHT